MLLASAVSKHAGIERGSTADFRFVDDLQWSPLCTIGRTTTAIVLVIDDDADVREGLRALLESVSLRSKSFKCAPDFFRYKLPDTACCLIVDVRLPGLSGLEFQAELAEVQIDIPIIFITGYGDIAMSVKGDKVTCSINHKEVWTVAKSDLVTAGKLKSSDGVFGLRSAHNTEVFVTGLKVSKN